jgi:hypothetical protein
MFRGDAKATALLRNVRSERLFLVFTGYAHDVAMDPLRFFQVTGIADQNILLFRDLNLAHYQKGISSEISTLEGIAEHADREIKRSFAHVTEVFCIGTSSGGLPAIYCGHMLRTRAVWCFGARICQPNMFEKRFAALGRLASDLIGRELPQVIDDQTITPDDLEKLMKECRRPEVQDRLWRIKEDPQRILDLEMLGTLVEMRRADAGRAMLHLYYSLQNAADSFTANSFSGIPKTRLYPLESPQPDQLATIAAHSPPHAADAPDVKTVMYLFTGLDPSHHVVKLLDDRGLLAEVIRRYL